MEQEVKIVKDVRVSTEKNNFRVRTSRSSSPRSQKSGEINKNGNNQKSGENINMALKAHNIPIQNQNEGKGSLKKQGSNEKKNSNTNQNPYSDANKKDSQGKVRVIKTSGGLQKSRSKSPLGSNNINQNQNETNKPESGLKEKEFINNNKEKTPVQNIQTNASLRPQSKEKSSKPGTAASKKQEKPKSREVKETKVESKARRKKDQEEKQKQINKQQRLQKMEEDDQKRKQLELQKQREEEKQLKQEAQRLKNEAPLIEEWNKYYHERYLSVQKRVKQNESWEQFKGCSGKPKLNSQIDLNAFMYHFKENISLQIYKNNWPAFLDRIQIALEIVLEVIGEKLNCVGNYNQNIDIPWYLQFQRQLTDSVVQKFDDMIVNIVGKADQHYEKRKQELAKQDIEIQTLLKSTSNEERQKIEIFSDFKPQEFFRFGFWINPVGKAGYRVKPIDFSSIGIQAEVPRTYMSNRLIMTVNWVAFDYLAHNYQPFFVVGGILNLELFEYPQLPRIEQNWTMKQRKEKYDDIKKLHYPNFEGQATHNFQNITPVKIFFQIPSYIYINSENVKVATFEKHGGWQTDLVNDVKFIDQEKTVLTFAANKIAPFAIVAQRVEDFPFRGWRIRCFKENVAKIDIQGRRLNLSFEIGGGYICLLPDEKEDYQYPFQHLVHQKMLPGQLLNKLLISGINMIPHDNDAQYAVIDLKNRELEKFVTQEVVRASSLFCIKFNHWNEESGQEKIIVSIKENPEYEIEFFEEKENDWLNIIWWKNKCGLLKLKENDKQIDYTLRNNSVTHSNLEITLREHNITSQKNLELIKDKNAIRYWNTLQQFLALTRLFSFTSSSK